jgi:hypothetical protein
MLLDATHAITIAVAVVAISAERERQQQQSFALIFTPCNLFVLSGKTVVTDISHIRTAINSSIPFNHAQISAAFFCICNSFKLSS